MNAVGAMQMPADFKYRDVFLKGKPEHEPYDSFRLRHPGMNRGHRAKIFSPFDALRGFSTAILAKDVLYENRVIPEAAQREELDRRLRILHDLTQGRRTPENRITVTLTYFVPCEDEDNDAYGIRGQYRTVTGICRGVDIDTAMEIRVDRTDISFEDILRIEIPRMHGSEEF